MDGVLIDKELNVAGIDALFSRSALALIVKNFCGREQSAAMSDWFFYHEGRQNYRYSDATGHLHHSDTDRVGVPFSEFYKFLLDPSTSQHDIECIRRDLARTSQEHMESISRQFMPLESPIDSIKFLLNALWPSGAKVATFMGLQPCIGLARIIAPGAKLQADSNPHLDWLPPSIASLDRQFSAITYLDVPAKGGELEIWNVSLDRIMFLIETRGTLRRVDLPDPISIKPEIGDLILIDTRNPHAVRGFEEGRRIVQTCFIGAKGDNPLLLWS
ncbi:2OG-Fe(II) oxygenase [Duganella dendranthematis]|uniref:2OG-Fe(II) oxygenase n=1 Tax=Duganella dendranthematis TaxID=2728021 RepID=A0ABX6M766_9BURK|nr:2OG-Fe(II) oxygenase [Duganella dendranthematis]QJD90149.1 2OG-Fe(II) oxygenase [Duganella dendranthematis]